MRTERTLHGLGGSLEPLRLLQIHKTAVRKPSKSLSFARLLQQALPRKHTEKRGGFVPGQSHGDLDLRGGRQHSFRLRPRSSNSGTGAWSHLLRHKRTRERHPCLYFPPGTFSHSMSTSGRKQGPI